MALAPTLRGSRRRRFLDRDEVLVLKLDRLSAGGLQHDLVPVLVVNDLNLALSEQGVASEVGSGDSL
jgi:hypothetical protein